MKTILINLLVILIVISVNLSSLAQDDFTVTIPSTDKYSGLCKPEKANVGFSLPVKVKSNISDTCTISIDKLNTFRTSSDWFQVDKEKLTIVKNQTITFTLTVKPPAGIQDGTYVFNLYFDATGKSGVNRDFNQNGFTVIVDNSVPSILEFYAPTYGQRSTSLEFTWNAFDEWSNYYTMENDTAGINGIARYIIVLKNQSNQEVDSKPYDANDADRHTFAGLASNTQYTAYLTATDVAGNQKTSAGLPVTTPPRAPTNFTARSITYCSTNLTWDSSPGATSYNVYKSANATPINTTGTSYTVAGLTAGTSYEMYVEAVSSAGKGDKSKTTFTTLAVPTPTISGPALVCSSSVTFTASNVPSGCTLSWNQSPYLNAPSVSGNSATFTTNGNGLGWVTARFVTCGGNGYYSSKSMVWFGLPPSPTEIIGFPYNGMQFGSESLYDFQAYPKTALNVNQYEWRVLGGNILDGEGTNVISVKTNKVSGNPIYFDINVRQCNACGMSDWLWRTGFVVDGVGAAYSIFPNPTSDDLIISPSKGLAGVDDEGATYSIFPNPTSGDLIISPSKGLAGVANASANAPIRTVQVVDKMGNVVMRQNYGRGEYQVALHTSFLPIGIYLITINGIESHTFIKE